MAEDATVPQEASQAAQEATEPSKPTCQSCGTPDVSRAALVASSGLKSLPLVGRTWLEHAYGLVPEVMCAACFIPALSNANQAIFQASQAPA